MDFARVEIERDGRVYVEASPLHLSKGTPLVVLDVNLQGNVVYLRTHTAAPIAGGFGLSPTYGCTEFIFHLAPSVVEAGNVATVIQAIEPWLKWTPSDRVCSPDSDQLCVEP
jgi:hypothetical protein